MFERFTDRARGVLVHAQEEARRFNHEYIGTEHLLLGLILEGGNPGGSSATHTLCSLGLDLPALVRELEALVTPGPAGVPGGKLPLTPRLKEVVEHATQAARDSGHNYVGTDHLLVGLLREPDGVAGQVLRGRGVTEAGVFAQLCWPVPAASVAPEMGSYFYSFSVRPSELYGWAPALFQLFHLLNYRVEMVQTEAEFESFRAVLSTSGFVLREVERVPYHAPQSVP
jgi:hypothetical protein